MYVIKRDEMSSRDQMCRQAPPMWGNDRRIVHKVDTASRHYHLRRSAAQEEATPALYSNVNRSVLVGLSHSQTSCTISRNGKSEFSTTSLLRRRVADS